MWLKLIPIISCALLSSAYRLLLSGALSFNVRYQRPGLDDPRVMDFDSEITPKQIHEEIRATFGITERSLCGRGLHITYGTQTLEPDDETAICAHETLQMSSGEDNNLLIEELFVPDYILLMNMFHQADHQALFGDVFSSHILPKYNTPQESSRIYRFLTLDHAPPGRNIKVEVNVEKRGHNTHITAIFVTNTMIEHEINWKCVPEHVKSLHFKHAFNAVVNTVDLRGIYAPNLEELSITRNSHVQNIILSPSFSASVQLTTLDLSCNWLQSLDLSAITAHFTSLRTIDVSFNRDLRHLDLEPLRPIQSNLQSVNVGGLDVDPIAQLVSLNGWSQANQLWTLIYLKYEGFRHVCENTKFEISFPKWGVTQSLYNVANMYLRRDTRNSKYVGEITLIHNGRIITPGSTVITHGSTVITQWSISAGDTVIVKNTMPSSCVMC